MSTWNAIESGLPPRGMGVLIWLRHAQRMEVATGRPYHSQFFFYSGEDSEIYWGAHEVSHWMVLPAAPQLQG